MPAAPPGKQSQEVRSAILADMTALKTDFRVFCPHLLLFWAMSDFSFSFFLKHLYETDIPTAHTYVLLLQRSSKLLGIPDIFT